MSEANKDAVKNDERGALLASYIELNMSNYGPDDVDALNAWAIDAYHLISGTASTQAAPADDGAEPVAIDAAQLTGELWRASAEKDLRDMAVFAGERFRGTLSIRLPSVH